MKLNKINWYPLIAVIVGIASFAVSPAFAFGPQPSNKAGQCRHEVICAR